MKLCAIVLSLMLPAISFADVAGDLDSYFNSMGFSSNATNATVVQGQEAGYLSGGSLFLRNPVKDVQVAQLNLPSINAGCGGINMFGGSFSFINSQELIKIAKAALQNAVGVGFQIAMQEIAPGPSNVLSDVRSWMNEINQMDMNSCTAAYAVAGLVTKGTAANQTACKDLTAQGGKFSDWAASAEGCNSDSTAYPYANSTDAGKITILVNKNIVWTALGEDAGLTGDTQLKEFLMSISGTITFDDKGDPTFYPSLAKGGSLTNLLLNGSSAGTAKVYVCDTTDQCLAPSAQNLTYTDSGLVDKVANDINDIQSKLNADQPLTAADQSFLSSVPYPLLSYMQIAEEGKMQIDFSQFAEAIADEVLIHYLDASAQQVRTELVEKTNFPKDSMDEIYANIDSVIRDLNTKYARDSQSMAQMFNILQNIMFINQTTVGKLSSQNQLNMQFGAQ